MAMQFKKATRKKVKLKMLIIGPTGAGKTYGALHIADGLAPGKVALLDSEHDRADYYADVVPFEKASPETHHPKHYIAAIHAMVEAGFEVGIIDSLSHCWLDVLARKDAYDKANPRSNPWTNWALFGAEWDDLMRAILEAPIHLICTARSKMAHEQVENGGRKQVVKLGLAPQLRENSEYEMAVCFAVESSHYAQVSKDNTNLFSEAGKVWDLTDGSVPALLRQWMSTAREIERPTPETQQAIDDALLKLPESKQSLARRRVAEKKQQGLAEVDALILLQQLRSMVPGSEPAAKDGGASEAADTAPANVAPAMTLSDAAAMKVRLSNGEVVLGECDDNQLVAIRQQAKAKGRARLLEAVDLVINDRLEMERSNDSGHPDNSRQAGGAPAVEDAPFPGDDSAPLNNRSAAASEDVAAA